MIRNCLFGLNVEYQFTRLAAHDSTRADNGPASIAGRAASYSARGPCVRHSHYVYARLRRSSNVPDNRLLQEALADPRKRVRVGRLDLPSEQSYPKDRPSVSNRPTDHQA